MQDQTHFIIFIALQMQQIVQEPPVNCNALPIKQTISHRVIQKRLQILLSYKGI